MVRSFVLSILVLLLSFLSAMAGAPPAPGQKVEIFPMDQVKAGLKGTGYTVFEGEKVEPFPVEILGVMKNVWGPRQHIILARLGDKVDATGVAGGMSGSPVYVDGKLLGAVSLRIGMFTKEPIAGITPAGLMLEINELDATKPPSTTAMVKKVPIPGELKLLVGTQVETASGPSDSFLTPIEAPLSLTGFSDGVLKQFGDVFRQMGLTPVQGGAGSSIRNTKPSLTPEELKQALPPGSAFSAVMMAGDLSAAATCTVTYNDGRRVLGCGHPFLNFGQIEMPMSKAEVLTVLGSSFAPNKIVNATEVVGALRQDRHSGIMGILGETAPMIPVELTLRSGNKTRTYNFQVLQNPKFTPFMVMLGTYNTLFSANEYGDDVTFRVSGGIQLDGYPELRMENLYANAEGMPNLPGPMGLSFWISERFSRVYNNPVEMPKVKSIKMNFDIIPERRTAAIEHVWVEKSEARPGETLAMKVYLRPYRGERIIKDVQMTIPATAPKGDLRVQFSDAEGANRSQKMALASNNMANLGSIISMMNREQANGRLYVTLLQSSPTAFVEDKILPSIPSSVANVIDSSRVQNKVTVLNESSVQQEIIPLDYVVSGTQTVVVTVK